MRRLLATLSAIALLVPLTARADDPPIPETGFAGTGTPGTCVRPDPATPGGTINPYGNACTRLKFSYGPIVVQPGDNDTGVGVQTIEKPRYDGYMVGIIPNMVRADGSVPKIDEVHLHHATWLSEPSYGNGPFFAAGEEKTAARFPVGYGMPVKATDVWYFVNMVHNQVTQPETVWITYHIDYVAKATGDGLGIKPIKPFWLDVWKNGRRANYPVYNTHRGFGKPITDPITLDLLRDSQTGASVSTHECTWPRENCSAFDSWSGLDVGQGRPGNGKGTDIYTTKAMEGTLIGIGGHLHPGGTRVEVDSVRCTEGAAIRPGSTISSWTGLKCPDADGDGITGEQTARIFTSDAVYFDKRPVSWNFSMTVAGLPYWKVNLREGEFLRINSSYETTLGSWYEGMGIAVAYVTPGFTGLDPFTADVVNDVPASECWAAMTANTLCTRGTITHGPLFEASNAGGRNISAWAVTSGPATSRVAIGWFYYLPGDLGTVEAAGVPIVKLNEPLTWVNVDAGANIFHTVTACEYPCNGSTGIAYPIADFGVGPGAPNLSGPAAFDSSELGFSPDFGPARGTIPPNTSDPPGWARDAVTWTMVPRDAGLQSGRVYTYFCRIHPFMRGAFKVE